MRDLYDVMMRDENSRTPKMQLGQRWQRPFTKRKIASAPQRFHHACIPVSLAADAAPEPEGGRRRADFRTEAHFN
jgi:hypothetical protein